MARDYEPRHSRVVSVVYPCGHVEQMASTLRLRGIDVANWKEGGVQGFRCRLALLQRQIEILEREIEQQATVPARAPAVYHSRRNRLDGLGRPEDAYRPPPAAWQPGDSDMDELERSLLSGGPMGRTVRMPGYGDP